MDAFEAFEQDLHEALNQLYDPTHPQRFRKIAPYLKSEPQEDIARIQSDIIHAIQGLKPSDDTPPDTRSWRLYNILLLRYVQRLTQEETAEHLRISPRHLRREQNLAIRYFAWQLWNQSFPSSPMALPDFIDRFSAWEEDSSTWQSQVKEEIISLQKASGQGVTDFVTAAEGITGLLGPFLEQHKISLKLIPVRRGINIRIQPAVLRQILIQTISEMSRHLDRGEITINTIESEDQIAICVSATPVLTRRPYNDELVRELLSLNQGSIKHYLENQQLIIEVCLSLEKVTILVVDDNLDLVHFYDRFVQGTRYHLVHLADGSRIFETIDEIYPDIIVLDVMLPKVDGWELLSHLHNHPTTRSIPVIVCSVVRDPELAMALGAIKYLPKPIRRQQFLETLEEVSIRLQ
jgi:CheY-like chemotaxis protein